jgi:hypothetical protein
VSEETLLKTSKLKAQARLNFYQIQLDVPDWINQFMKKH